MKDSQKFSCPNGACCINGAKVIGPQFSLNRKCLKNPIFCVLNSGFSRLVFTFFLD